MFKKIDLPYSTKALEPYYSEETLKLHYDTLYTGYVDNANKIEEKLAKARQENNFESIKCLERDLSFYGSGAILHQMFFENMGPTRYTSPDTELTQMLNRDFGSFAKFKSQFTEAAKAVEASGWCILAWVPNTNKLEVLQCEKHQNLTLWGCMPLLVLDMWEHSYYLQYKTKRPDYVNSFWNIVNWNVVNERFKKR